MTKTFLLLFLAASVQADRLPNVVLFLVDDLGWRDTGCYGSSFHQTPRIDRLAEEGVRFTDAYAACHVCSPTRASILTGKYPARLGLTDWITGRRDFPFQRLRNVRGAQSLPFEETTLAETLRAAGYRTAAIGKWHLGRPPSGPAAHGFEVDIPSNHWGGTPRSHHPPLRLEGLEGDRYLADRLTDEALRFMEGNSQHPFFLYLSHFAVHDPIQGPPELVREYRRRLGELPRAKGETYVLEGNPDGQLPPADHEGYRVFADRTVKVRQRQDNPEFAAMVEAVDRSLGRVLDRIEALGLEDDTLVIFFSDNGGMSAANFGNPKRVVDPDALDQAYSTSNLPLRGAKGWLYEGGIRVPLVIRWPRAGRNGAVCSQPVISTDLYPTVLEAAGLPFMPEQHRDGTSLLPLLKRPETLLERVAIFWHFPHYSNHGMQSPAGAVRSGPWKLLEYFENGTLQLFHLGEDIGESRDLAAVHPRRACRLQARLQAWRESLGAVMPAPNPDWRPRFP